eukprot:scaffold152128_cov42-Attheya_sp.AAC.1
MSASMVCGGCGQYIRGGIWFGLDPCGCCRCGVCFGRVHATRRLKLLPKCPCRGCGSDLTGHSARCYDEDCR